MYIGHKIIWTKTGKRQGLKHPHSVSNNMMSLLPPLIASHTFHHIWQILDYPGFLFFLNFWISGDSHYQGVHAID